VAGTPGAQARPLLAAAEKAGYKWDELVSSLAEKESPLP